MKMTPASLSALVDGNIENFIAASTPGGIEAQEKRGQIEQAAKQTLPLELHGREHFEALGFVFGATVDNLFQEATFPVGWKKQPTDHSMWSDLVDGDGNKRGSIFYKAAFYDRSAHASLSNRFHVAKDYGADDPTDTIMVVDARRLIDKKVTDLEKPNWSGDRTLAEAAARKQDEATEELRAWLDTEYPEWKSPVAYWD